MVRRARTVTPRSHALRIRALCRGVLFGALAMFAGCIGGAQPVPPALEPDSMFARDAGADASRGFVDSGAMGANDAASPPPDDDNLADFAGERSATPDAVHRATDNRWRWSPFPPPQYFRDAGVPVADDLGTCDESVDAE